MSEPIDIPTTTTKKSGVFSYFTWKTEPENTNIVEEKEIQSTFEEDKGIFPLSSSESENDSNEQSEQDHSDSDTYSEYNDDQEDRSCCTRIHKKIVKYTGVNTMELVKEYEIVVDKANKDFDKFWEKCTPENFNLYTDAVLRNFAHNFHWFLTGVWFYSIQKPNKVYVPIYVSDCGHVCAEI
tara:strand:- start:4088 stop:4633 length:546 start_codon:yes stop_codon:yes gene_type:complete